MVAVGKSHFEHPARLLPHPLPKTGNKNESLGPTIFNPNIVVVRYKQYQVAGTNHGRNQPSSLYCLYGGGSFTFESEARLVGNQNLQFPCFLTHQCRFGGHCHEVSRNFALSTFLLFTPGVQPDAHELAGNLVATDRYSTQNKRSHAGAAAGTRWGVYELRCVVFCGVSYSAGTCKRIGNPLEIMRSRLVYGPIGDLSRWSCIRDGMYHQHSSDE